MHHRGARGVRAPHQERHHRLRRASTTKPSSARPRRKPTSSSGTAATTTSPSTSPTSRSSSSTRTGPATRCSITPARPTSAGPTSSSSTRSTPRPRRAWTRSWPTSRRSTRRPSSSGPTPPTIVENGEQIRGKRVLVIEDGPTVTHGGMTYGAGIVAAQQVRRGPDRRPAPGGRRQHQDDLREVQPPRKGPAGHGLRRATRSRSWPRRSTRIDCDLIVSGTPIDLNRLIKTRQPMLPVGYELEEIGSPNLEDVLKKF